jgi:hypothetical protein
MTGAFVALASAHAREGARNVFLEPILEQRITSERRTTARQAGGYFHRKVAAPRKGFEHPALSASLGRRGCSGERDNLPRREPGSGLPSHRSGLFAPASWLMSRQCKAVTRKRCTRCGSRFVGCARRFPCFPISLLALRRRRAHAAPAEIPYRCLFRIVLGEPPEIVLQRLGLLAGPLQQGDQMR